MRRLYHFVLSPYCRKVRIVLAEKGLDFDLRAEKFWDRRQDFLALNPAGKVPVLMESNGDVIAESAVIAEFLDEAYPDVPVIGAAPAARAEARRIAAWFDLKFGPEVSDILVHEKIIKRYLGLGGPDAQAIRAAAHNIGYHLDYVGYLADRRRWLAGEDFGLADICAAAHLSCADYLNDVAWEDHEAAKNWYARVKSRPSFRPLLADHLAGMPPPRHYANLDF